MTIKASPGVKVVEEESSSSSSSVVVSEEKTTEKETWSSSSKSVESASEGVVESASAKASAKASASASASAGTTRTSRRPQCGGDLGVHESSLEDRANFFSQWALEFLTPLLRLGSTKVLDQDDIGIPSKEDWADRAYEVAQEAWAEQTARCDAANRERMAAYESKLAKCRNEEQRKKVKKPELKEPSIASALVRGFGGWRVVLAIVYYVVGALMSFIPVIILNDLVKFFETGADMETFDGWAHPWIEVVGLAVFPILITLLQTRHQVVMAHCAVFVRTAVSTMLYRKSLRVSSAGRAKTSTGQVVNMMSNDTTQLQRFLQFAGLTIVAPLQIIISLALIYQQVGNATWVGVGFMLGLMPINTVIFGVVSKMRRKVLKYSDLRVKMMNEILAGIRIIKFYAWERPFGKEVAKLREEELKALTRLAYVSAIGFSLILLSAPIIQPILVFLAYVNIQDEPLDASTAFTTVALFNIMRFPFAFLPMGFLQYIQSRISLRRLERFLQLPELQDYVLSEGTPPVTRTATTTTTTATSSASYLVAEMTDHAGGAAAYGGEPGSITITNGTFSWIDPDGPQIRPIQEERKKKPKRKRRRGSGGSSSTGRRRGSEVSMSDSASVDSGMQSTMHGSVDEEGKPKAPIVTLKDITLSIDAGSLVAIVGPVGSGKSSLLSCILGEMEALHGSKVYMPRGLGGALPPKDGFVSYAAQTPWIVNDTLRNNVVFGREFDQERYDQVVEACALLDDLVVLPAGDMTEIGERGINLSGGQKARVSLARALYARKTKILLCDDPLSAVDAHVGEHIFSRALTGEIGFGLTRVLVTHHVHFLPRCDKVIVMERGHVKHEGRYDELVAQGVDFAGAVDVSKMGGANHKNNEKVSDDDDSETKKNAESSKDGGNGETIAEQKKKVKLKEAGKMLVKKEEREEGSVSGSAYVKYARAGGFCMMTLSIAIQAGGRGAEIMSSFWLSEWAEKNTEALLAGDMLSNSRTAYYLGIYAVFGMAGVIGLTVRALALAVHRLKASRTMHENLTESILRAPVAFFDVTPIGRVLNRFAADMDKIDLQLTQSLAQGFSTIFSVLGAMGAIVAATKGTFLIPLIPIGWLYHMIQKWFRKTSTELQRINSIANSPIFADFSQTLSGTSTIRAYGEEKRFFSQCMKSFDDMNASYLLVQLTNHWLGLRLDILGGLIGAFVGGVAVATSSADFIPAGWLGLALSYSIEVTGFLKHGVRMIATVEAEMNSVERVLFYSENIESEAPEKVPERDPPEGTWPTLGKIEIKNASMRYRDGPLVLKELSLTFRGGEKVGVVGRTGSGKSSLMVSLFRISEIEDDGGQILIDGIDTATIGTSALRWSISIIPQDPVMFSNTVRYNLDPFASATDEQLWEVLKKVQLAELIASLPAGLEEQVAEGGENFSQGQRQLLCIARSLLRKPKILVLDEATASIDNATDAMIQQMIRENFGDATVLTIAHRLGTIMDSDRILVLDDGRLAEFDTPDALMNKPDGIFKAMLEKSRTSKQEGGGIYVK